jgi:hypothetical protein
MYFSKVHLLEGIDSTTNKNYQNYDKNALILSEKNAGNIDYLKDQIDNLNSIKQTVFDLSNNYFQLNDQVQGIAQQQAQYAQSLNGGSSEPISVSGINTAD